jgi:hypothetical protein
MKHFTCHSSIFHTSKKSPCCLANNVSSQYGPSDKPTAHRLPPHSQSLSPCSNQCLQLSRAVKATGDRITITLCASAADLALQLPVGRARCASGSCSRLGHCTNPHCCQQKHVAIRLRGQNWVQRPRAVAKPAVNARKHCSTRINQHWLWDMH